MSDFPKTRPSGSGTVTKTASSVTKIKPSITNEGTGFKLGVPDVAEEESYESEAESWGNNKDDSNNEHVSSGEDSDQEKARTGFKLGVPDVAEEESYENIPHTDAEIISPMDVYVDHEVPSQQTPTLLIVHASVISYFLPVFSIIIPQSLPSFTPPPQQSTYTPPPTAEATNP
nr:hypothetical protein [Tanacetum cinerariifolium]